MFGVRHARYGRNRTRLDDPELLAVVAPLDVLRRAVVPFDADQQRRERGELRGRQRRTSAGVRAARSDPRGQHGAAGLADAELVGIDLPADQRVAEPARRVDYELA